MEFHPVTIGRWRDLETLFGPRGACAGCWCMWWRTPRSAWTSGKGEGNKHALHTLVRVGPPPGILAYDGGEPVGWCAIAPRSEYSALARSRVLAPFDDREVWSVTCFFVARGHRRRGLTVRLLEAAVRHARASGARIVEGYPVEPRKKGSMPDAWVYTGLVSAYERAGFVEVARRSDTRPIMRRSLRPSPRSRS